jgi:DMSO/TMAO reductase YedYZ molybdopterin-dependent catalytic subunit
MNEKSLPTPQGALLRVRIERQLGNRMAKYICAST